MLADQPLNYSKTDALFSARAVRGHAKFDIKFEGWSMAHIESKPEFKYIGYIISSNLGWGKLIKQTMLRVGK